MYQAVISGGIVTKVAKAKMKGILDLPYIRREEARKEPATA